MTDQRKKSIQHRWNDVQPSKTMLFWSCVGSVVVALVVGFTWGGWVTGSTAREMAATAGDESRYELASAICVERFLAAPNANAQLTELQAIDSSYRQRQFVEAGGWATMPSMDAAARESADLCAEALAKLKLQERAGNVEAAAEPVATVQ